MPTLSEYQQLAQTPTLNNAGFFGNWLSTGAGASSGSAATASGPLATMWAQLQASLAEDESASVPTFADTYAQMLALMPDLEPYRGDTDVEMTPYERNIMALVNSLVQGETGRYRELLSGRADNGLLTQAVINPMRREFEEYTLPGLEEAYSGGPYGADYHTGARRAATERGRYQLAQDIAGVRYSADQAAQDRSLNAMSMLPSMFSIQDAERLNDIANIEREIKVHFLNQGLSVQEAQLATTATVAEIQRALGVAGLSLQEQQLQLSALQAYANYQLQRQAASNASGAGVGGTLGAIIGAGIGSFIAPGVGTVIGAQMGSGLGQAAGGGATYAPAAAQGVTQGLTSIGLYNMYRPPITVGGFNTGELPASTGGYSSGTAGTYTW